MQKNDDGKYTATSSIYEASWKRKIKWDGGRKAYLIEEIAIDICNGDIDNCD